MTKSKTWKYNFFVGIDVSRNDLDVSIMHRSQFIQHYKIGNNTFEITSLIKELKASHQMTVPTTVFGMEQTGIYCNHLLYCLEKLKANVVVQNAKHIKNSLGTTRGKNDKIDSLRIAGYLVKSREELLLWNAKRPIVDELARLSSLRDRLISVYVAVKTPLNEEMSFLSKSASETNTILCKNTLLSLKADITELENYIAKLWKEDEHLKRLMEVVMSVPGVGPVTALQIIITSNEFIKINDHKKFACYCGVAPFEHKSGTSVRGRTKVSNISNKKMKSLIHTCALSASRFDVELRSYYLRKTEGEGKNKMSVLNAVRFKLIARIFSCVKANRLYDKEYKFMEKI